MDKVKTKQKVFGMKGHEYEGVEWCAPSEAEAIGEKEVHYSEGDVDKKV